ncbi:MAG: GCN5-related N-acetyltransferase [Pseudomonadota bacterium]
MTHQDEALRQRWRTLVHTELPAVARARGWPIVHDHCFARVLLDNALEAPWRTLVSPPAWRNTDPKTLAKAIALGEAAINGEADMHLLNRRSLRLRGKRGPRG